MPKAKNEKIPKNEFSVNVSPRDEQKCIPAFHTFYPKSVIRISLCRTAKTNPNDRFGLKVHLIIFTFLFGAKLNYESCMAKSKLTQNGEI